MPFLIKNVLVIYINLKTLNILKKFFLIFLFLPLIISVILLDEKYFDLQKDD